MVYERTGYAPWSLTREAGVESATVDSEIQVPQYLQPVIDTGFVDEKGNWQGRKSNDRSFIGITKAEGIADGAELLAPDTNVFPSIDMTGFDAVFIAIKPSNGGNYGLRAVMGPDTESFANLSPVDAASKIKVKDLRTASASLQDAFVDSAENLTVNVWNIYNIQYVLANQKNMQFAITNNSGGASDIEFAFMRTVGNDL